MIVGDATAHFTMHPDVDTDTGVNVDDAEGDIDTETDSCALCSLTVAGRPQRSERFRLV